MRILAPALLPVLLLGCRDKGDDASKDGLTGDELPPGWTLTLALDAASTTAGDPVGYTLTLTDPDGAAVDVDRWSLSSDLESGLLWTPDDLRPTLAAQHTLTATVADVATDDDGAPLTVTATAVLSVGAGPAYDLDLALSDAATSAGVDLRWTLTAVDAYGNDTATDGAVVTVDDPEAVAVADGRLSSTVPGTYLATAALDGLEDVELFVVTPGEAAEIRLIFDDQVELYETRSAKVELWDAYGNPADDAWTLTVDTSGGGLISQSYLNVTFLEEGWYTVTATVDGSGLSDAVGPFLIDSTGPEIVVTSPGRGTWNETGSGTVTGTVTDAWSSGLTLTVSGETVPVASDGSFSKAVAYDFGLNILETAAVDGDGNESVDTRAVLSGDFLPYGDGLASGLVVRLHEGSGGLDTLEALGAGLISGSDLDDLIPSPVFSDSSSSCTWFGCVTWYSVALYAKNPSIGSTTLDLDPQSSGRIKVTFKVYDPELDWTASGKVTGISYSGSGDISADSITVTMELTPTVNFLGNINTTINSVSATSSNFDFNFNGFGWLETVLGVFGFDVDATIEGYMTDAIEDAVYDAVPDLLEDTLQDLELSFDVDILGNTYTIVAEPDDIDVDSTGITLSLETMVDADTWTRSGSAGLGSLYGGYAPPAWTGSPGAIIGVSDDFLNQVLYALWGGGVLDMSMDSTELGLDPADLSFLLGDVETLSITVDPLLPPVVVPGTGGNLLDLQLGDMFLQLDVDGAPFIEVYVSAIADLDVSVDSDQTLSASLGEDLRLSFDVVYPDASSAGAADTEALLAAIVPLLLPSLTDALGEIQIPSIEGFTISSVAVGTGGTDNGYLTLGGSLKQK